MLHCVVRNLPRPCGAPALSALKVCSFLLGPHSRQETRIADAAAVRGGGPRLEVETLRFRGSRLEDADALDGISGRNMKFDREEAMKEPHCTICFC
jgi:hypothetical protein